MVKKSTEPNPDLLHTVEHTDDVVEYTLRVVLALAPGLSQAITRTAEAQVRSTFGGARVYVGRRSGEGTAARNEAIRRDYRNGERLELLERRYGIGRTQIWRIVNDVPSH
jgi:Mor family transcriptional regulator